jgi:hypothetical protein
MGAFDDAQMRRWQAGPRPRRRRRCRHHQQPVCWGAQHHGLRLSERGLLPSQWSAQHLADEILRLRPHPCLRRSRPRPPGCGAPPLQQVAAPALLSRRQPAGQKGRHHGHRRRSSLGNAPGHWQGKLCRKSWGVKGRNWEGESSWKSGGDEHVFIAGR